MYTCTPTRAFYTTVRSSTFCALALYQNWDTDFLRNECEKLTRGSDFTSKIHKKNPVPHCWCKDTHFRDTPDFSSFLSVFLCRISKLSLLDVQITQSALGSCSLESFLFDIVCCIVKKPNQLVRLLQPKQICLNLKSESHMLKLPALYPQKSMTFLLNSLTSTFNSLTFLSFSDCRRPVY